MTRRSLRWTVGLAAALLCLGTGGASLAEEDAAAEVDCAKPILPCTACHSAAVTKAYAKCLIERWEAPAEARELKSPFPVTPKVLQFGKASYEIYCDGCHGPLGDGKGHVAIKWEVPVVAINAPIVQAQTDGDLFWKISNGRGAMPAWATLLPEETRWQLTYYVRTFKGPAAQ
jgi:hypothetical protein